MANLWGPGIYCAVRPVDERGGVAIRETEEMLMVFLFVR